MAGVVPAPVILVGILCLFPARTPAQEIGSVDSSRESSVLLTIRGDWTGGDARGILGEMFTSAANALDWESPMAVEVNLVAGSSGGTAYSMAAGDGWRMNLPAGLDPQALALTSAHELTHGLHTRLAGLTGAWRPAVGHLVLGEGLAMRVAAAARPGGPPWRYTGGGEGWFREADASREAVLSGVLASLDDATTRAAHRFLRGPGPAGLTREAYYAGWVVMGHLLETGWTLAGVARVPRGLMVRVVERALREMLDGEG